MTQNTAPTCPAPVTSPTALHALADELRSGATVLMPATATTPAEVLTTLASGSPIAVAPAIPSAASSPIAAPAPAARVLRQVQVSCRCEQYLRGEPAPTEPLALVRLQANITEADAVEHLHRATCSRNALEVRMLDGEDLYPQVTAAYMRQHKIEQIVAKRWGVAIATLQHDI